MSHFAKPCICQMVEGDAELRKLCDAEVHDTRSEGPCYDLCMCSHCWRGWSSYSFWRLLWWRILYILRGDGE